MARRFQPDALVNSRDEDLPARLSDLTGGAGPSVVIVAVGSALAQEQGIELAGRGARVIFFAGLPHTSPTIALDANKLHYKQLSVYGMSGSSFSQQDLAMGLLTGGAIDGRSFVTHTLPIRAVLGRAATQSERRSAEGRDRAGPAVVTALLLGLDAGTSACRAALYDTSHRLVALATSPLNVERPAPGWVEQDVESIWTAARETIHAVLRDSGVSPADIAGVAGLWPLADAHPARPRAAPRSGRPSCWQDTRASTEALDIGRIVGGSWKQIMGAPLPVSTVIPSGSPALALAPRARVARSGLQGRGAEGLHPAPADRSGDERCVV